MAYVHRQIERLLTRLARQFPAIAVTGPRQCGKSTLLKELFRDYRYVSFDDPISREQALSDPKLFLETAGDKAIIDEIQYVPQLLSYVKMAIDADRQRTGRFIFTGSQQFAMIKNLGDSLAGRIALLELLPFHAEEKQSIPRLRKTLSSSVGAFAHACLFSSYPDLSIRAALDRKSWYGSYISTYLERDIRTLYDIGNLREFQRFMQLLAARTSQLLNLTEISRELGTSVNTLKKWVSILEASRMIYLLPPYYQNLGKRIIKSPKVYFLDCGLVCYLTGIGTKELLLNGPMAGPLFENFCVQETLKTLFFQGSRPRLYYVRSYNGLEVDLLIEGRNMKLFPCEIKLTKTPRPQMGEPIRRLAKLFPKLPIKEGRILCLAEEDTVLAKNFRVQPLKTYWAWLRRQI